MHCRYKSRDRGDFACGCRWHPDPNRSVDGLISFEGPNGWKYSRRVVDPKVFDQVKVGDKVDIIWSTDLTVAVE